MPWFRKLSKNVFVLDLVVYVITFAIVNEKVAGTLKETRSHATRRTFVAEMLSVAVPADRLHSLDDATRQRHADLKDQLEQQRHSLAVVQARHRVLSDLVTEMHKINVASLPGSFLTQRSPMVTALEELNSAAAAVANKLKSHSAAIQQARKRVHLEETASDPLELLLSAAARPVATTNDSQTQQ